MAKLTIAGKPIIAGSAKGAALVSSEPLSFWGGYDWKSGEITDRRHPLSGSNAKGKVLAIPFTLLREASQSLNLKLVRVAETLTARRADMVLAPSEALVRQAQEARTDRIVKGKPPSTVSPPAPSFTVSASPSPKKE